MIKWMVAGILTAGMLFAGSAFAIIYQYVDDNGQTTYTNDLSSVPADKLADIIEYEEYENKAMPESPPQNRMASPQPTPANAPKKSLSREKREQREKLEAEYTATVKEKEALDNNKSFQKRREKRKYQNRPYIQALIKKETQLINRLAELKAKLKTFEK